METNTSVRQAKGGNGGERLESFRRTEESSAESVKKCLRKTTELWNSKDKFFKSLKGLNAVEAGKRLTELIEDVHDALPDRKIISQLRVGNPQLTFQELEAMSASNYNNDLEFIKSAAKAVFQMVLDYDWALHDDAHHLYYRY